MGNEVGEDQERHRVWWLLDQLEETPGSLRGEEMEFVEDHHLSCALRRGERRLVDDLLRLLLVDSRAHPSDLAYVGMLAAERQRSVALVGVFGAGQ